MGPSPSDYDAGCAYASSFLNRRWERRMRCTKADSLDKKLQEKADDRNSPRSLTAAEKVALDAVRRRSDDEIDLSDPDAPEVNDWSGALRDLFANRPA